MKKFHFSLWQWGAYAFYFILVFCVAVYITFPASQFHSWLIAEVGQRTGVELVIKELRSQSPLRFDIMESTLSIDSVRVARLSPVIRHFDGLAINEFGLELDLWSLFLGKAILKTKVKMLGGEISGMLTVGRDSSEWHYRLDMEGTDVALEELEARFLGLKEADPLFTAGTVDGKTALQWIGKNTNSATGAIALTLNDTNISVVEGTSMPISQLSVSLTRDQNGWWRTDNLRMVGLNKGLKADGQGSFLFNQLFGKSMINLSIQFTMDEGAKIEYPQLSVFMPVTGGGALLAVTGTVDRPIVQINGVPILAN